MKVALLSFHNAYNYGASLQAYALQHSVEKLGVECEYINYQNDYRAHSYDMKYQFKRALQTRNFVGAVKSLLGIPVMSARAKGFDRFYSNCLKTTGELFRNSKEAAKLNGKYDKFIVGSDQVWNYSNNGGDTAYLLDFVGDDSKKISYSSSFGISSLTPDISGVYSKLLKKFARLSTRESIGTQIIEDITGKKAHLVLDPVFLLEREEWEKIRERRKKSKKNYIFFYTNRQSQIRDFLNTGYPTDEVYHVLSTHLTPGELLNPRIKTRIAMSPGEFLDEIAGAELVVTASFHCLALSIIYHKPFVVILTGDHGKDERITNLLKITGLESRVLTCASDAAEIKEKIDYEQVDRKIESYLKSSGEYLRNAIFDEPDIPFDNSMQSDRFCMDSRCTGCGACEAACPVEAISMKKDYEGFRIPVVDEFRCIRCGKCHSVCQVFSKTESPECQHYYAVKNSDEIRRVSSSGGVFRALAEQTFIESGVVCAAAMDKNFHIYHTFASNPEELRPMCGTYYVQSDLRDSYSKVEEYLQNGVKVLFIGTPCQVAGLRRFLGRSYSNLLTCDILCHSVASPRSFADYVRFVEHHTRGRVVNFSLRDKSRGWGSGSTRIDYADGTSLYDSYWASIWAIAYPRHLITRPSCHNCPFCCGERVGDISIGDFWGVERTMPQCYSTEGVSLVLVSTESGRLLWEAVQADMFADESSLAVAMQPVLMHHSSPDVRREAFWADYHRGGFDAVVRKYWHYTPLLAVRQRVKLLLHIGRRKTGKGVERQQ